MQAAIDDSDRPTAKRAPLGERRRFKLYPPEVWATRRLFSQWRRNR